MKVCDAHCHFFSPRFFTAIYTRQSGREALEELREKLGWDIDDNPEDLARRWARELDRNEVSRAALIASVPGDAESVAEALAVIPDRFVGFFMVDPSAEGAARAVRRALEEWKLQCVCLFPAMHDFSLQDERLEPIVQAVKEQWKCAVFVHCGALSVGIRKKLGLPSPFSLKLSNPLDVHWLASRHPEVPFIIPHFGAGMFQEALMAADLSPNIHFDTSSSNGWVRYHPGLSLRQAFEMALEVLGPERLLFGTDSSFFPRGWQKKIFVEQLQILNDLGLSEGEKEAILGGNFERLFGSSGQQE
jgi:uncharacterized protein